MLPNQPILYTVDNTMSPAYGRNELQVVIADTENPMDLLDDEPDGNKLIIKNKKDRTYIIKNIIDKKKEKNKIYYNVLWKGFKTPTWELRSELIKSNKDLINIFEKK